MLSQPKRHRTWPGIPVLLYVFLPRGGAVEDNRREYKRHGRLVAALTAMIALVF